MQNDPLSHQWRRTRIGPRLGGTGLCDAVQEALTQILVCLISVCSNPGHILASSFAAFDSGNQKGNAETCKHDIEVRPHESNLQPDDWN